MEENKHTQEPENEVKMTIVQPQDEPVKPMEETLGTADKAGKDVPTPEAVKEADDIGTEREDVKALKEAIHQQAREDEQPFSANFTLRKILVGDVLNARLIRSQIWLIVLVVFFIILYISNRYSVQKDLLEIDRLNTQLKDAKYKALSSSSMLTEKCRESHVLEMLKNNKDSTLKMPDHPPFIIQVPK